MQIKPPKRVSGKKFTTTKVKYKQHEWTCSSCLTHGNLGPYCQKCWPEENRKWRDQNE